MRDEDLSLLADLKLEESSKSDTGGTSDSKDIPRSYAEAVKTSSPTKGSANPTYQPPSARPKSPKKTFCEAAKFRAQSPPAIETPHKLRHVASKPLKSDSVRKPIGHDHPVAIGDRAIDSSQTTHQVITRGVSLDENTLRTTYQRQSATKGSPSSASGSHAAAHIAYPVRAHTIATTSIEDTTKGLGEWATPQPIHGDQSLYADIPRCVSTTSPHYQALLSLEPVVQCAAGDTNSSRSNRQSNVPKPRGAGIGKGGRGGKRDTGRGINKKGTNGEGDGDGSDHDSRGSDGPKDNLGHQSPPLKWYACPFHKHDPSYFCTNDLTRMRYKTCSTKGWDDISRLK